MFFGTVYIYVCVYIVSSSSHMLSHEHFPVKYFWKYHIIYFFIMDESLWLNCLPIVGYFSLFLSFLVDGEHSYIFILLSHDLLGINSLERNCRTWLSWSYCPWCLCTALLQMISNLNHQFFKGPLLMFPQRCRVFSLRDISTAWEVKDDITLFLSFYLFDC